MRINHNISSLTTQNALGKVQTQLDKSMKKLSTGLRINSAADDAAGMAISHKLRTQVNGLQMASRNSLDGVSLVQTAEGALSEVQNMLQRMRQLAIQSANDTLQPEDRSAIQLEIDQLIMEIDDTSEKTEFNKIKLLNGDSSRATATDNSQAAECSYTSDTIEPGQIAYTISKVGTPATVTGLAGAKLVPPYEGDITLNGEIIRIETTDSAADIADKFKELCDRTGVGVAFVGTTSWATIETGVQFKLYTKEFGSDQSINMDGDVALLAALGFTPNTPAPGTTTAGATSAVGTDAVVTDVTYKKEPIATSTEMNCLATCDGNEIQITADSGQVVRVNINAYIDSATGNIYLPDDPKNPTAYGTIAANGTASGSGAYTKSATGSLPTTLNLLDFGPLELHVGPNENMTLQIQIPSVDAAGLAISNLNLSSREGAEAAIPQVDEALDRISDIRARLGAYQNRLEYTVNNLDTSRENATSSLSRVEDTDMAAEMSEQTQKNVLSQAGVAILAQANQRPQQILSLLQ